MIIAAGIYPPEMGGVSTIAYRVANELLDLGHMVTVIAYGDRSDVTAVREGLTVICASRSGGIVFRYARYFLLLLKHVTSQSTVLVTDILSTGLPLRVLYVFRKPRVILRLGGERSWENAIEKKRVWCTLREYWRNGLGGWQQKMMRSYYHWFCTMPEKIVVVSPLIRECFERMSLHLEGRLQVIPNRPTRNVSERGAMAIVSHQLHHPLRLLYVGRMARVKNVIFLAQIIKKCAEEGLAITCDFIGEGEDLEAAKKMLATYPSARFLGNISFEQVNEHMQDADLLVVPSLTDIYPNVVIEALAVNLPVLLTDQTGLEPGFGGIVFASPFEPEAWMRQLRLLCTEEGYHNLKSSIRIPDDRGPSLVNILVTAQEGIGSTV